MRGIIDAISVVVLCAAIGAAGTILLGGCAGASDNAKRAGIGVSYGDRVMDCSDLAVEAGKQSKYDECMDDVDRRFGLRAPADAGADQ